MIYTIGYKEAYEEYFRYAKIIGKKMRKRGRQIEIVLGVEYNGGSVWKTEEEAREYIESQGDRLEGYEVYGVLASWEEDTEPSLSGYDFHDLLVDAEIVRLSND